MRITSEYGKTRIFPIYQNVARIKRGILWTTEFPERKDSHASSSHELFLERMRSAELGKHSVLYSLPERTKLPDSARGPKSQGPCAEDVLFASYLVQKFLVTWLRQITKFSVKNCESRNTRRHAVVVQDLATQWIQSYPCKTKTSQETERSLQKFFEPTGKPEVIYTDSSLEFGKASEDLSWNHCMSNTTQITNKWDCWKSRCAEIMKAATDSVSLLIFKKMVHFFESCKKKFNSLTHMKKVQSKGWILRVNHIFYLSSIVRVIVKKQFFESHGKKQKKFFSLRHIEEKSIFFLKKISLFFAKVQFFQSN